MMGLIEELHKRFKVRWESIEDKSLKVGLKLPDKNALWHKLLECYKNGFECEYCSQQLLIKDSKYPYYRSFSFDHRTSIDLGGNNEIENFAIVCHRCNIIKGTMTESTFKQFLGPFLNDPQLLDKIFKEIWDGRLANKLEREHNRNEG